MTTANKSEIKWKLENYVAGFPSQRQAANSLSDVCSEATIINILSEKWADISDRMWMNLLNFMERKSVNVNLVETLNLQTLILYFSIAQENGATFAIIGGAGYGKSVSGKYYANTSRDRNVYYLECAEYWNKKMFLSNILKAMGQPSSGLNVGEMMEMIVTNLRRQKKPLIILDEVDKLTDPVLKFFITLYNELNGACGFVWTSTSNIEKRMTRGLNANKNGYQELLSRIGQRFIQLASASREEIFEICRANGITKEEDMARIANECNGDLRRVERNFLKQQIIKKRGSVKAAA